MINYEILLLLSKVINLVNNDNERVTLINEMDMKYIDHNIVVSRP
jgi:hypothetical protein